VTYLVGQADAGVDAVQLFDSWSGSLAPSEFERWVIAPTARIVAKLRKLRPELTIIGFPKGAGGKLPAYARETGVDALGLDETVDPLWAHASLPVNMPVQGNLDPLALMAGGEALEKAVRRVLTALEERPHVFNLGHGIGQFTPIEHVGADVPLTGEDRLMLDSAIGFMGMPICGPRPTMSPLSSSGLPSGSCCRASTFTITTTAPDRRRTARGWTRGTTHRSINPRAAMIIVVGSRACARHASGRLERGLVPCQAAAGGVC
jgi:hypothetical protein